MIPCILEYSYFVDSVLEYRVSVVSILMSKKAENNDDDEHSMLSPKKYFYISS